MKRPKTADEMTREELEAVKWGGELPEVDDDETLRAAGLDPETREPLETPEERDKRIRREEELEHEESLSVEDHLERMREDSKVGPG
jgi:hypothetical protein